MGERLLGKHPKCSTLTTVAPQQLCQFHTRPLASHSLHLHSIGGDAVRQMHAVHSHKWSQAHLHVVCCTDATRCNGVSPARSAECRQARSPASICSTYAAKLMGWTWRWSIVCGATAQQPADTLVAYMLPKHLACLLSLPLSAMDSHVGWSLP